MDAKELLALMNALLAQEINKVEKKIYKNEKQLSDKLRDLHEGTSEANCVKREHSSNELL